MLDEIHKFPRWRNGVNGLFDIKKDKMSFLVTGSARLYHCRKGGDSRQGHYHHYRLHPLSLSELIPPPHVNDLELLMRLGEFPEPFLAGDTRTWRRWQRERVARVVDEDLCDAEN
ncbi:MAG: AAA family ATPase [Rhodobacteraceae bacterium]|nr:AAA family ATPase [Paracoccaceae bacterium]MCY4196417.1 AAA family ATPase [Paracoccaceae bacterium]MCY4327624.1 AAA family ATPase [Paracoccaceae bacterium]